MAEIIDLAAYRKLRGDHRGNHLKPTPRRRRRPPAQPLPSDNADFSLEFDYAGAGGTWLNFTLRHLRAGQRGKRVWHLGWSRRELRLAHSPDNRDLLSAYPGVQRYIVQQFAGGLADELAGIENGRILLTLGRPANGATGGAA